MALRCYVSGGEQKIAQEKTGAAPVLVRSRPPTLLPASRRNDPIHSQIFHHLAIVIEAVAGNPCSECEPRDWAFPERILDRFQCPFFANAWNRFVNIGKGIL